MQIPRHSLNRALSGVLATGLVALILLAPVGALAAPDWMRGENPLEPNTLVRPPGITLEQAANKVRRETGGRVLSASPTEQGGRRGYQVRVLVDGKRVKSYFVDGNGRIRSGG